MASKVQREIGQTRPFASHRQEGVVALLRTADRVRRFFAHRLEPSGLTWQQYNVLRILRGAGSEGLPTMEIRRRMVEAAPGITRLVDRLVQRGWVERVPAAGDRRQVICRVTRAGLEVLEDLDPNIDEADETVLSTLGDREVATLIRLLDRARERLGAV